LPTKKKKKGKQKNNNEKTLFLLAEESANVHAACKYRTLTPKTRGTVTFDSKSTEVKKNLHT